MSKMSVGHATILDISTSKGQKMNEYELREKAYELAKEKYGIHAHSALWGSASVLLTKKDLETVVRVMEK